MELLEKFDDVAQGAEGPKVADGMGAEVGSTEVEPAPDDPAAAASDGGPAEEHVVHVVVDDSDDAGDPAGDLGADARDTSGDGRHASPTQATTRW